MFDIEIKLPGGGWIDAHIRPPSGLEIEFSGSYLTDASGDFLEAVAELFEHDTVTCWWLEEPGLLRWTLNRTGDSLKVRIEYFEESRSSITPPESENLIPDLERQDLNFVGVTSFRRFAEQVECSYTEILDQWGEDGYAVWDSGWGYSFPREAHSRLRERLARL